MNRILLAAAGGLLILFATGCAPARFVDGVGYAVDRHGVRSADTFGVTHRGYLRFDHALLSDLDDTLALEDADRMRVDGRAVLEQAHALAMRAAASEIERMPPAGLDELIQRYQLSAAPTDVAARRTFVNKEFATRSQALMQDELARLDAAATPEQVRRYLAALRRDVEPAPGDRGKTARALLGAPFYIPAAIGAEIADAEATQRAMTTDFEHVVRYEPPGAAQPGNAAELENASIAQLAAWFAPVFVQQVDPSAAYAREDDRIGRVCLEGTPENVTVRIDVGRPTVYWAHQQAKVGTRRYEQLVYVAWYPRRPALEANDPSAGEIDGVVVRITLDRHHRPAVYEFVRSCGCYHTLWVAEFVEAAARAEFGTADGSRSYAVQRKDVGRELFMPELVRDDGSRPRRPIVYVSAGEHLVLTIRPMTEETPPGATDGRETYAMEPYEILTRLPLGGATASMFGGDGLVHHAGRAEGWLLAPTGMLSAGQPRQLGTMKIRMDAYDYDDPRLLERNLRLPTGF